MWIRDDLDEKSLAAIEKCFTDEWLCLALRRFHCMKAVTKSVPDARLERDLLRRAPILLFFDPAGRLVKTLEGKRATSRSAVSQRIRKLWNRSYSAQLRNYLKRMDDILDRTEVLERLRAALESKKSLLKDQPRRRAALRKQEKGTSLLARRIAEDEQKIKDACRLREKYRPPEPEEASKKGS